MARQRRGGFKPPELRGTLGTLLRTAAQQASVVREAVGQALERGAREGRTRLDEFRADRRRHEALAELGEIVLELVRKGEIDLAELPEAQSVIEHLDELDAAPPEPAPEPPPSSARSRFDARPKAPVHLEPDGDGTVASTRSAKPTQRRAGRPTTVWQPPPAEAGTPPAAKQGGITFDEPQPDDDLAEYMHPDDVPRK